MLKAFGAIIFMGAILAAGTAGAETLIKCASTTSTQNSGLFDYMLPIFKQKTGIQVDVVAVGTGAASRSVSGATPMCFSATPRSRN